MVNSYLVQNQKVVYAFFTFHFFEHEWRMTFVQRFIPGLVVMCTLLAATIAMAAPSQGRYLGHLNWVAAEKALQSTPVVVIPFAAGAKEHGPHLPMNTDAVVMEYLVAAAVKNTDVLVVPPVLHGWFPAFRDYPGTGIRNPETFSRYIHEIALSLIRHGAKRIILLNMGIFKATGLPMAIAARELRTETGVPMLLVSWEDLETSAVNAFIEQKKGGHADEVETSINLFLQPDKVNMAMAKKDYRESLARDYGGYQPGLFSRNPDDPAYSASGVSGDPTLASAEKGKKVLAVMTAEWLKIIRGFATTPLMKSAKPE